MTQPIDHSTAYTNESPVSVTLNRPDGGANDTTEADYSTGISQNNVVRPPGSPMGYVDESQINAEAPPTYVTDWLAEHPSFTRRLPGWNSKAGAARSRHYTYAVQPGQPPVQILRPNDGRRSAKCFRYVSAGQSWIVFSGDQNYLQTVVNQAAPNNGPAAWLLATTASSEWNQDSVRGLYAVVPTGGSIVIVAVVEYYD